MDLAPDFDKFIGSLTAHGVEFVIVGAYALAFHGAPRLQAPDIIAPDRILQRKVRRKPDAPYRTVVVPGFSRA